MKKTEKKEQGMWDVLIPILLVIAVLPWVVRLAVYSCGYGEYDWYSANDILWDFYCYYKSYFLDVIGIFAVIVLAFRLGLYKEKTKNMKVFLPMGIYCIFVLLSSLFSVNKSASLKGNFESFESCIVLIVYVVLALYAYQVMEYERDYRYVWYAIVGISVFFIIIGGFQIFGHDLMDFEWVQRLIMSGEEFEAYGGEIENTFTGNNVYLTLYNPNYAGITLNMLFAVAFVMFYTEKQKKYRVCYSVLVVMLFVLIWFTYSRASLLAVVLTLVLAILFQRRKGALEVKGKKMAMGIICGGVLLAALLLVDAGMGFKYLSRMVDKNTREPLQSMVTDETGIHIRYDDVNYRIYIEDGTLMCDGDSLSDAGASSIHMPLSAEEGEEMSLPMEEGAKAVYYDREIYLYIAENTLTFVKEEDAYYYQTVSGKMTSMTHIPAADFHGLEYLGSARGYIWSRVLPLLNRYLLIGSGPDTFAEVFPQNDYAGKVVYSDRPDMIIEKAHNDYLTKWVQTGLISVICIVVFYILFIKKGLGVYGNDYGDKEKNSKVSYRIGFGCYLACISYMFTSLFNDSTLQTSPLFWVFAGVTLSALSGMNGKKDWGRF